MIQVSEFCHCTLTLREPLQSAQQCNINLSTGSILCVTQCRYVRSSVHESHEINTLCADAMTTYYDINSVRQHNYFYYTRYLHRLHVIHDVMTALTSVRTISPQKLISVFRLKLVRRWSTRKFVRWTLTLGALAQSRKAPISFFVTVRSSVCPYASARFFHGMDFTWTLIFGTFMKNVSKSSKFGSNREKTSTTLHEDLSKFHCCRRH